MTQTNEEIQDRMKKVHNTGACKCCDNLMSLLTTTKADWLRSEIEKLKIIKEECEECEGTGDGADNPNSDHGECYPCFKCKGTGKKKNQALTSIITRYKEELKVLESKA